MQGRFWGVEKCWKTLPRTKGLHSILKSMIDPSIMAPDTWPFRSTLMRRNECVPWLVIEHCAKWLELEDVEEDIPVAGKPS